MVLSRDSDWVWDSWYVVDDDTLHAFTLTAPKSLGDPDLRHVNARVGHSISRDGITWQHLPDAFGPSGDDVFDGQATWTGSIVRANGQWHMFYTGINRETMGRVQAVGHAVSDDLTTWERVSSQPTLSAARPYALLGNPHDGAEHFRDPWVFEENGIWHMLVTASDEAGWGTVAHATSSDLTKWQLHEPLVRDSHLLQLEVTETIEVDGKWFLIFCAQPRDFDRSDIRAGFGTYCVPADGPVGPFHLERTELLAEGIYAGRAVWFRNEWVLFGFIDSGQPGDFTGTICDPIRLGLDDRGMLAQRDAR